MRDTPPGTAAAASPWAKASLVSGLLAWCVLPVLGAVLAVGFSALARRSPQRPAPVPARFDPANLGLWLGLAQLVLALLLCATLPVDYHARIALPAP
jgi:hypothetical protein